LRRGHDRRPRRLLSYSPGGPLSGGRVVVEMVPAGGQRIMAGTRWAAWAGEEIGRMTERARVASLPDEAPVEDLPLRLVTVNRLRRARVRTLGQLRGMRDRELLALRLFGRGSLAEVRAIVLSPEADGP
jgi:RNA polymerase alpha subunit